MVVCNYMPPRGPHQYNFCQAGRKRSMPLSETRAMTFSSESRRLLHVRLGVADGLREDGDDLEGELGDLEREGDSELVDDGDRTGLELPLAGSLDLVKKGEEDESRRRGVHT